MGSQIGHYMTRNQGQVEPQQVMCLIIYVSNAISLLEVWIRWGFLALLFIVILIILSWFWASIASSPLWEWYFWAQETMTPKSTHEEPFLPLKQVWVKAQYLSMLITREKARDTYEFLSVCYFIFELISADLLFQYNSTTASYAT